MSLIDDIRKDREAGTNGPWVAIRNSAFWEVNPDLRDPEDPYTVADCCASDPGDTTGLQEVNARRIARVPALEEAYLAALDALEKADELAVKTFGAFQEAFELTNHIQGSKERFKARKDALAAYRTAREKLK